MEEFIIREAKIQEVEKIAELHRKLNLHHRKLDPKYYARNNNGKTIWIKFAKKRIKDDKSVLLVALHKNRIISYALGFIKENPPIRKIRKYGYILDVFVEEKNRIQRN